MTDWIAIWRARKAELGLTDRQVDDLIGWGENYCGKVLCGKKTPTAPTIDRMNAALALRLRPEVDIEREAIVRAEAVKRRRI
jgi:hypothetical protein